MYSTVKGKVGVTNLLIGRKTVISKINHKLNDATKTVYCKLLFIDTPLTALMSYAELSANTVMVTVVEVSEFTEFAVVVISKSNFHVPAASRFIES